MSKIIIADNHAHISKEYFEKPVEKIKELEKSSGLEYLAIMGIDYENNIENLEYKKLVGSDFLRIGLGLHPEAVISLGKLYKQELERIIKLIRVNKDQIDFIGEVGIDFFYPNSRDFENEQKLAFREFVRLSQELNIPMSIHARESFDEVMEIIDDEIQDDSFHGFLHCFTGNFEQGMFFIEKGFKLGIGGIITYKKSAELRQTVKDLLAFYKDKNFNDLFGLETDTPYLSPEPIRSQSNSPENIKYIAEYIEKEILLISD